MFEQILLKKLIYSGEFFSKVVPIIKPNHFTSQGCSKIYGLLHQYYYEYKQIPTITELVAQVKNVPNVELRKEIVTELQAVSATELVENTEFMIKETVDFVKNAIFTEALIIGSDAISEKDENKILKSKELMEEMSKISIDSDLGLDFDDIEAMIEYYQNKLVGVLTQHLELNKRLGTGFLPGTLSIIMAASGIGKSLLMTDLVSGNIKEGKNVLLVSMEMEDKEIMKRVHANALGLPINKLTSISPDAIRIAHEKFSKENTLGKFYIKDYPTGTFSPLMLDALLDNYKTEKGIEFDIIYLDYLGIMKSDLITANAGLYSYIKSIVEETRSIAKKRRIPIVSASQLNRSATGASLDIKSVDNDSVSDSIGTVQTADFIMFLLQTPQMKEEGLMTCKVTKNRFTGRTDYWDMNINYDHMKFSDAIVDGGGMDAMEVKSEIATIMMEDIAKIKAKDNALTNDFDSPIGETPINEEFDINQVLGL